MTEIRATHIIFAFDTIAGVMEANRDALCVLDGEIGDADHGIGMALGFGAVRTALAALGAAATPTDVFNTAAKAFLNAVGGSTGPLYATAFMRAAAAVKGKDVLGAEDIPIFLTAMTDGIAHRGKAALGDKTMLDVWRPAAEAAQVTSGSVGDILCAATGAAETAAKATMAMEAKLGRAARLGARSVGHVDPGAASAAILIRALADSLG
jgi:dihydroxyacetone kinase-like protein